MFRRCVRNERAFLARRCAPGLLLLSGFLVVAPPSRAQVALGPITVGAGLRTSYVHTEPDGGDSTDQFLLNSARLYVNGPVTDKIKFMFNTEYDGATNHVGVLDAVAQFEFSPKFNIWAGRFLPPSDRANLYGPYYAHHWAVYTDGVQDGYPFVFQGRDNGVVYWGQFDKSQGLGRRVRRRDRDRQSRRARRRPRPGRFLGSGRRLLPERHLLRRQEPARHRRAPPRCRPATRRRTVDFLLEKKLAERRRVLDRERVRQLQPAGRLQRALRQEPGRLRALASYLFPEAGRHRQVPGPRQVSPRRTSPRANAARATTTRRPPKSTSTTSSSSSTRA